MANMRWLLWFGLMTSAAWASPFACPSLNRTVELPGDWTVQAQSPRGITTFSSAEHPCNSFPSPAR
jgi:hypothetical protein